MAAFAVPRILASIIIALQVVHVAFELGCLGTSITPVAPLAEARPFHIGLLSQPS